MAQKAAGERAKFVPCDRRIGNLMQAFDVMVMASPAEGFSLLIAEAWYCGVPAVATRVGAVPELEAVFGRLSSNDDLTSAVAAGRMPAEIGGNSGYRPFQVPAPPAKGFFYWFAVQCRNWCGEVHVRQ